MSTINVGDLKDIRAWAAALDVTPDRLMMAIQAVGPSVYPVIRFLNKTGSPAMLPPAPEPARPHR